jgi:hypothetical protein
MHTSMRLRVMSFYFEPIDIRPELFRRNPNDDRNQRPADTRNDSAPQDDRLYVNGRQMFEYFDHPMDK